MLESVRQRQRETCKEEIRAIVSYQHEHAANQQLQTFHVSCRSTQFSVGDRSFRRNTAEIASRAHR